MNKNLRYTILWDIFLIMLCLSLALVNRLSYMFLAFSAVLCFPYFKDVVNYYKTQEEENTGKTLLAIIACSILIFAGLGVLTALIFTKLNALLYTEIAIVLVGGLPSLIGIIIKYVKNKKLEKETKLKNNEIKGNNSKEIESKESEPIENNAKERESEVNKKDNEIK